MPKCNFNKVVNVKQVQGLDEAFNFKSNSYELKSGDEKVKTC